MRTIISGALGWVILLSFSAFGLTLTGYPAPSKSDSLRLLELMQSSPAEEKRSNERNRYLQEMMYGLQDANPDTGAVDTTAQNKRKLGSAVAQRDSLIQYVDSLQRSVMIPRDTSGPGLKPFGHEFFASKDQRTFNQTPQGPVPPDYILGPGDEILVSIWGDRELNYSLVVDREGKVNVPDLGIQPVNGLSLSDFRDQLTRKLSKVYSTLRSGARNATTFIDVSMGKLRPVRVYLFGEVTRPGSQDVSGMATAWSALMGAGGPTSKGSLRNLSIIRGGKPYKTIDAYKYLTGKGSFADDRLENNDVLFVPIASDVVYLKGEVQRPAIYELVEGSTMEELLDFCGGFTNQGYPKRIQVERWEKNERKVVTDIEFDTQQGKQFALQTGDSVFVFPFHSEAENFFTVSGEVQRPGRYELEEGMKLSAAIAKAGGLSKEAYLGRVDVLHLHDDSSKGLSTFHLGRVLANKEDTVVGKRDQILIYSVQMFRDAPRVSIWGEVRKPGYYDLVEGMTVEDLLFVAEGFSETAYKQEAEISRVIQRNGEIENKTTILKHRLPEDFEFKKGAERFVLAKYDMVFVRPDPQWSLQKNAVVLGEVRYPGKYSISRSDEGIAELVKRAGGIRKETAYLPGAIFKRSLNQAGRIALDFEDIILKNKKKKDVSLLDGDTLIIPRMQTTVKVIGEVGLETSVLFRKGANVGYYVDNAGGLKDTADPKHIKVILANGRVFKYSRWGYNPDIIAGSTIVVDAKPPKTPGRSLEILTQSVALLTGVATLLLLAVQLNK